MEPILPKEPKAREKALKSLNHSFSMYDFFGNHKPHPREKENLLDLISKRDAYVIDSNSDWRDECKKHLDKAFIITPALSRENQNTKELILEAKRCKLGNIFSVGIDLDIDSIMVDRIDEYFRYVFNDKALAESSRGVGEHIAKQRQTNAKGIEVDKFLIRGHIRLAYQFSNGLDSAQILAALGGAKKTSDLPSQDCIQSTINVLKTDIKARIADCKYNVNLTKMVAEMCYAVLLLEDADRNEAGTRTKFDKADYPNVFGDMYILQGAIMLGAKIMTKDKKLIQMANYAGIKCDHVPQSKNQKQ